MLRRTYDFQGQRRHVVSTLVVTPASARIADPSVPVAPGTRPVRVTVRIEDRGRSPFPFEWARFALVSRTGAKVTNYSHTPLRRLEPGRRRSARLTILTFAVPRGFRPSHVQLRSIVGVWRFRGRWPVRS